MKEERRKTRDERRKKRGERRKKERKTETETETELRGTLEDATEDCPIRVSAGVTPCLVKADDGAPIRVWYFFGGVVATWPMGSQVG